MPPKKPYGEHMFGNCLIYPFVPRGVRDEGPRRAVVRSASPGELRGPGYLGQQVAPPAARERPPHPDTCLHLPRTHQAASGTPDHVLDSFAGLPALLEQLQ